jgi:hypothetical protein
VCYSLPITATVWHCFANVLIATGASGITGWAITNAILEGYPDEKTFSKVTALTNRPLSIEAAQWPASAKLQVVSGLDLLTSKGQEGLNAELKSKVQGIETVTHVFFFGWYLSQKVYLHGDIDCELQLISWTLTLTRRSQLMSNSLIEL